MALNNRTAKIGDQFKLDGRIFTVHTVSPAGSGGRSFAAGPSIGAWLRPGGYGVTIDDSTPGVHWIEPESAAYIRKKALADLRNLPTKYTIIGTGNGLAVMGGITEDVQRIADALESAVEAPTPYTIAVDVGGESVQVPYGALMDDQDIQSLIEIVRAARASAHAGSTAS